MQKRILIIKVLDDDELKLLSDSDWRIMMINKHYAIASEVLEIISFFT